MNVLPDVEDLTESEAKAILQTLQGVLWSYEDSEIDPDKQWDGDTLNDIGQAMARLRPVDENAVNPYVVTVVINLGARDKITARDAVYAALSSSVDLPELTDVDWEIFKVEDAG